MERIDDTEYLECIAELEMELSMLRTDTLDHACVLLTATGAASNGAEWATLGDVTPHRGTITGIYGSREAAAEVADPGEIVALLEEGWTVDVGERMAYWTTEDRDGYHAAPPRGGKCHVVSIMDAMSEAGPQARAALAAVQVSR